MQPMQIHRRLIFTLGFVLMAAMVLPAQERPAQERPAVPAPMPFKFTGPGSCSSGGCHGSVAPKKETRISQNEYSIWVTQDAHARAFATLEKPVSVRMAKILGLNSAAAAAPKCLACHALSPPASHRGRAIETSDGVSCESCHGPASEWLGPHSIRGTDRKTSLQAGMIDTKNPIRRTEVCASCHVGTAEKWVDHEMIAAGHPALLFEVESYSNAMPAHWKVPAEPAAAVRSWSVGQAVQLREGLRQLARRAQAGSWPEYSELDCFSCHHSLTPPMDSWRQAQGYEGRRAGDAPWNKSSWQVLRVGIGDDGRALEASLADLAHLMARSGSERARVAELATRSADQSDALARALARRSWNRDETARLMQAIVRDADRLADQGARTAEQTALALQSLNVAHKRMGKAGRELDAAIAALFQQLQNPSSYHPRRFAAQVKKVGAAIAN
ncbi:MAG: multiheme c-type cytochrome [Terriglobales bacterium]